MNNYTGKPALFVNPQKTLEIMEHLKKHLPEEYKSAFLEMLDGLTQRDMMFYSLGKFVGHDAALTSFENTFCSHLRKEKAGDAHA